MLLSALLVLGYGPLNWAFPWWVWAFGIVLQMFSPIWRVNTQKRAK